ncbi:MAG: hypothetical protein ABEH59_10040 [Halobacteriales archaeon]
MELGEFEEQGAENLQIPGGGEQRAEDDNLHDRHVGVLYLCGRLPVEGCFGQYT